MLLDRSSFGKLLWINRQEFLNDYSLSPLGLLGNSRSYIHKKFHFEFNFLSGKLLVDFRKSFQFLSFPDFNAVDVYESKFALCKYAEDFFSNNFWFIELRNFFVNAFLMATDESINRAGTFRSLKVFIARRNMPKLSTTPALRWRRKKPA